MSRPNVIMGALGALVFVVAVVVCVTMQTRMQSSDDLYAIVHDGDGGTHTLSLSQNQRLDVITSLGRNTVIVEQGAVYVVDADCETHDCMQQGSLSQPGKQIICLPHKLWIEVVEGDAQGPSSSASATGDGPDAVAR